MPDTYPQTDPPRVLTLAAIGVTITQRLRRIWCPKTMRWIAPSVTVPD